MRERVRGVPGHPLAGPQHLRGNVPEHVHGRRDVATERGHLRTSPSQDQPSDSPRHASSKVGTPFSGESRPR